MNKEQGVQRLGRFELKALLGRGGAARVYRAYDPFLGKDVAIKVLNKKWARDAKLLERFRREAGGLRMLKHPGVPVFHEMRRVGDSFALIQELFEGETLSEILKRETKVNGKVCVPWFIDVLGALAHIHDKGIIHRDLKPSNIIIGEDGAKIIDFGLSRLTGTPRLTMQGRTVGTLAYLSKEQAVGKAMDARTDIYAIGVTLYKTLTGELPFDASDRQTLAVAIMKEEPRPLQEAWPAVDSELQDVVLRALAKKPENRYQRAEDFAATLSAWQTRTQRRSSLAIRLDPAAQPEEKSSFWRRMLEWCLPFLSRRPAR